MPQSQCQHNCPVFVFARTVFSPYVINSQTLTVRWILLLPAYRKSHMTFRLSYMHMTLTHSNISQIVKDKAIITITITYQIAYWHIYVRSWSILKFKVNFVDILTAGISKMVTYMVYISVAIWYEVAYGLSITIIVWSFSNSVGLGQVYTRFYCKYL